LNEEITGNDYFKKENIVKKLFSIEKKIHFICQQCKNDSETNTNAFYVLKWNVKDQDLEGFFKNDSKIDNQWKCKDCTNSVATTKIYYDSFPSFLIVKLTNDTTIKKQWKIHSYFEPKESVKYELMLLIEKSYLF
jgi:hypothetical protein